MAEGKKYISPLKRNQHSRDILFSNRLSYGVTKHRTNFPEISVNIFLVDLKNPYIILFQIQKKISKFTTKKKHTRCSNFKKYVIYAFLKK